MNSDELRRARRGRSGGRRWETTRAGKEDEEKEERQEVEEELARGGEVRWSGRGKKGKEEVKR